MRTWSLTRWGWTQSPVSVSPVLQKSTDDRQHRGGEGAFNKRASKGEPLTETESEQPGASGEYQATNVFESQEWEGPDGPPEQS